MWRYWLGIVAAVLLISDSAFAQSRMALVIGNSNYQAAVSLSNPANDAKAVAEAFTRAGFEVTRLSDLTQMEMRRAVRDFSARIAEKGPDTIALVYYAGHGVQVDGENFLVPIDARIQRESDVPIEALRLADIVKALETVQSRTRIVMLDACRNNPFSSIGASGRGLAIVDAPTGSIVAYSTAPGTEAGITISAIFAFSLAMQEYLYAVAYVAPRGEKVVTVGLATALIRGDIFYWGSLMAGSLVVGLPIAILYSLVLDQFIEGLTGVGSSL